MPVLNGRQTANHLRRKLRLVRISVVSNHSDKAYVHQAFPSVHRSLLLNGRQRSDLGLGAPGAYLRACFGQMALPYSHENDPRGSPNLLRVQLATLTRVHLANRIGSARRSRSSSHIFTSSPPVSVSAHTSLTELLITGRSFLRLYGEKTWKSSITQKRRYPGPGIFIYSPCISNSLQFFFRANTRLGRREKSTNPIHFQIVISSPTAGFVGLLESKSSISTGTSETSTPQSGNQSSREALSHQLGLSTTYALRGSACGSMGSKTVSFFLMALRRMESSTHLTLRCFCCRFIRALSPFLEDTQRSLFQHETGRGLR